MANVLIEESTMTGIADAIRAKTGGTDLMLPAAMPDEIAGIQTGSGSGSGGLTMASGETTSATIDTGLSGISFLALYATGYNSTGLLRALYRADEARAYLAYCSMYSTYGKTVSLTSSGSMFSVDGGTFTWNGSGYQALASRTYYWVAFGTV